MGPLDSGDPLPTVCLLAARAPVKKPKRRGGAKAGGAHPDAPKPCAREGADPAESHPETQWAERQAAKLPDCLSDLNNAVASGTCDLCSAQDPAGPLSRDELRMLSARADVVRPSPVAWALFLTLFLSCSHACWRVVLYTAPLPHRFSTCRRTRRATVLRGESLWQSPT